MRSDIVIVIGGSASGKSEFAEQLSLSKSGDKEVVYLATMRNTDPESLKRIEKHKRRRKDGEYYTIEEGRYLSSALLRVFPKGASCVLLEGLGTMVSNFMFGEDELCKLDSDHISELIIKEIIQLADISESLIIVSDNVFGDGNMYDEMTAKYIDVCGKVISSLSSDACNVYEVVAGIPIKIK
ncbi:MAG: bifunctional adenosylcobinamide kinase/adenosylcobinamide-phosphate guanylyltransferase [Lachnospiraceae bacterium]|nr:bifunctional adenosylcobinamide kinase/adenosylcobinamide-phosphate guanylyltransferase [Lachnospiraceae bacterium]